MHLFTKDSAINLSAVCTQTGCEDYLAGLSVTPVNAVTHEADQKLR